MGDQDGSDQAITMARNHHYRGRGNRVTRAAPPWHRRAPVAEVHEGPGLTVYVYVPPCVTRPS